MTVRILPILLIEGVPESSFEEDWSDSFTFTIQDNDINFGSGNYLVVALVQDNTPFAGWESQQIPVVKSPPFELSPSSLALPCGDTSAKTFTVTNTSGLGGITYQWNIGNGWLENKLLQ